jgi:hypothetical protein
LTPLISKYSHVQLSRSVKLECRFIAGFAWHGVVGFTDDLEDLPATKIGLYDTAFGRAGRVPEESLNFVYMINLLLATNCK